MRKDIKDEWVRRLRSGDYEQGTDYLRFGDKYCCLGVLCDMAVEAGVIEETYGSLEKVSSFGRDVGDRQTQRLPISVAQWSGLMGTPAVTQECAEIRVYAGNMDLMEFNDNGTSFEEIATAIEIGIEADE